jgi:hypothetical protein
MSLIMVSLGQVRKTSVLVTYLVKEDTDQFTRFVLLVI